MRRGQEGWTRVLLVSGALLAFAVVGSARLDQPGLQYDEVLFVNAAIGADRTTFVHLRLPWWDVPLTVMPYLGALKAWLFTPIFALAGVTPWTVRWPMVWLGVATVFATYAWVGVLFGRSAAVVALLLVASDPGFWAHARVDVGPTGVMGLCQALLLVGVLGWVRRGRRAAAVLAVLAAAAGVFDKLNFMWSVVAISGAVLLCDGGALWRRGRSQPRTAVAIGVAFAGIVLGLVAYTRAFLPLGSEWTPWADWAQRFVVLRHLMLLVVSGSAMYERIYAQPLPAAARHALVVASAVGVGVVLAFSSGGLRRHARGLLLLALVQVLLLGQMVITRQATGPHHVMMLVPFALVMVAAVLSVPFDASAESRAPAAKLGAGLLICLVMASGGSVMRGYFRAMDTLAPIAMWDAPSQQSLASFAATQPQTRFVHVDWGTHTPLLALSQGRAQSVDLWPQFRHAQSEAEIAAWLAALTAQPTLFVLHAAGREIFPDTRVHFLELARLPGWAMERVVDLPGAFGRPTMEVVRLRAPNS